jgi:hypothetical protein
VITEVSGTGGPGYIREGASRHNVTKQQT